MKTKTPFLVVAVLAILMVTAVLLASSGGKTGRTQSGCTCHGALSSGNATINLTSTPDIFSAAGYTPGITYTLKITVTGGPFGSKGGFNLKASAGTLTNAGNNVSIIGDEATHSNPDARSWTVDWAAPDATVESVTFYYAGNAADGGFDTSGDDPTPVASKIANKSTTKVVSKNATVAKTFQVFQNYPNPFNMETKIKYQIDKAGDVELRIFDIHGNLIFSTKQHHSRAGNYMFGWDGKTVNDTSVTSGIYLYQVKFNNIVESKKLIVVK